jgi:hypothetical protein
MFIFGGETLASFEIINALCTYFNKLLTHSLVVVWVQILGFNRLLVLTSINVFATKALEKRNTFFRPHPLFAFGAVNFF